MDTYEAKELLADSLRCLCRSMEQIRLREIGKVVGYDEPMQDHLAECTHAIVPYEDSSVEVCLEYLKLLYKGFTDAYEHEHISNIVAMKNKDSFYVTHICDMVRSFIGHGFPDNLVACAREINDLLMKLYNPYDKTRIKSEKDYKKLMEKFIPKTVEIIKKYNEQMWNDGEYSLTMGYLEAWMYRLYWEKE